VKELEAIPGIDPMIIRAIRTTPPDHLIDWKLVFRDPLPVWTSPAGHVVQLGDSAHSFLPSSGSGATQAVEDAFSLAACLQLSGTNNILWATRVHTKLRFERCAALQLFGWYNKQSRDATNWKLIEENPDKLRPEFGKWVWAHDPETYAFENYGKAFNHLANGAPFVNTNIPKGYSYKPWTLDDMMELVKEGRQVELEGNWFD
jgi:2-polyprenyl-6-methoxyphenol hydroxylase-like FAD-dependent oxidoreductase